MSEDNPSLPPPEQAQPAGDMPVEADSFPHKYSKETFVPPAGAEVSEFERTPEGYLELEWQYRDTQRALALDFDSFTVKKGTSREQLERAVQDRIGDINNAREAVEAEPVDVRNIDENFLRRLVSLKTFDQTGDIRLRHLARPVWQEHLPTDDSEEATKAWEDFKSQYPEHMQINLEELRSLDGKLKVLSGDQELQGAVAEIHAERLEVMRAASAYLGAERKIDTIGRRVAELYRGVGTSGRSMTGAEKRHIDRLQAQIAQIKEQRGTEIKTPELLRDVSAELKKRIDIQRKRDFDRGLVLTDQMRGVIDEILPSLSQGKPVLFVGETGGAKTALAEYISRYYFGVEPELISGYGDVNSYQMMGKMNLREENGAPVSDFVPGPLVVAMEEGRPLILDEINAMPAEFLKRLNRIVQLKPGDSFKIQEDSGRLVTIKPGFVIIATANEKSRRYKGIEDLSVEFQNRFGANVVRIEYPDSGVPFGEAPVDNAIIARAALTGKTGELEGGIEPEELERFVRACHVSQQVFSGNFEAGFRDFIDTEHHVDGKPGLDDAVLAPRTMVDLLGKVRGSYGKLTLDEVLRRFVSGIKDKSDRAVMTDILDGQSFLKRKANDG